MACFVVHNNDCGSTVQYSTYISPVYLALAGGHRPSQVILRPGRDEWGSAETVHVLFISDCWPAVIALAV